MEVENLFSTSKKLHVKPNHAIANQSTNQSNGHADILKIQIQLNFKILYYY